MSRLAQLVTAALLQSKDDFKILLLSPRPSKDSESSSQCNLSTEFQFTVRSRASMGGMNNVFIVYIK